MKIDLKSWIARNKLPIQTESHICGCICHALALQETKIQCCRCTLCTHCEKRIKSNLYYRHTIFCRINNFYKLLKNKKPPSI